MVSEEEARDVVVRAAWPVFMALGFVALAIDSGLGFGIIIFGMLAGVPLAAALFDGAVLISDKWFSSETSDDQSPLEHLRERYAKGEITDEEFEHKLERLLDTNHELEHTEVNTALNQ